MAAITQMEGAGLRSLERSERAMAAIGLPHTPASAAEGSCMDVDRGRGSGAGQGWRTSEGEKGRRFAWISMLMQPGSRPRGLETVR